MKNSVRRAVRIISFILMAIVGLQSFLVIIGNSLVHVKYATQGGVLGVAMAVMFLIAGAFAMSFPTRSMVAFLWAALFGLVGGSVTPFSSLTIWGVASLIMAGFSIFGWREARGAANNRPG